MEKWECTQDAFDEYAPDEDEFFESELEESERFEAASKVRNRR